VIISQLFSLGKPIAEKVENYSFILADTEQLHEKIYEMSNRIRQLEDALAILQSSVSDQRHPLLNDELLKVKFGSESINARETPTSDEDHATQKSIDALGTLTLGNSGKLQYLGRSAGSEVGALSFFSLHFIHATVFETNFHDIY